MKLSEAQEFAHKIMDTRGLREQGWRFEFDNAKRRFGCTHYDTRKITLSRALTELNDEAIVHDTILHEIAHVIAGYHAGHGYEWKSVARVLGCSGNRTYNSKDGGVKVPPKKWSATCKNCNRTIQKHRRTNIACGKCCDANNNGRYSSEYLFIWKEN